MRLVEFNAQAAHNERSAGARSPSMSKATAGEEGNENLIEQVFLSNDHTPELLTNPPKDGLEVCDGLLWRRLHHAHFPTE
jgi:hypothetical protein